MDLSDNELAYLNDQPLGRLATLGPDGAPQTRPVGFFVNQELGTIDIGGHNSGAGRSSATLAATPGSPSSSTISRPSSPGRPAASRSAATPRP